MFRRIAIIGGGAAAAALFSEIVEHAPGGPLHLDWYTGGTDEPGPGLAYGTGSPRHLLNVRAASMGMFAGRPRGFLDFVQQDAAGVAGTAFLPRHRYGDYLRAEVAQTRDLARAKRIEVRLHTTSAEAIVPESDGVTVLHQEARARHDAAVLAIGMLPPRPLAGVTGAALASGRYVVEPWGWLDDEPAHPAPAQVALIGSGLTGVDMVLELAARWPGTRFTLLSRRGLLPEVHLASTSPPDGDGALLVDSMTDAPEIRRWVRLVREATREADDWRTVIDGLRPHTPALWATLPEEERARFLRHARWAWERARHRMAPAVAEALAGLERGGRLQRHRGRLRSADWDGARLRLTTTRGEVLEGDLAIQTVGADADVRRTDHPLARQLTTNGYVTPDPLGLGWQALPDGRLCRDRRPWDRMFALGGLLRGTFWECTAMPEIRQQARTIARQLVT